MPRTYLFLLLILITSLGWSQNVSWGVKAGGNFATLTNNSAFENRFGLNFGAVADIEFSPKWGFQPELFYSAQGYEGDFNGQDVTARIDYFNLPILAQFKVTDGFSLQAGPQLGINVRSEQEVEDQEPTNLNVTDIDFGVVIGVQVFLDDSFFIQGRYNAGLNEVLITGDNMNSVFSISLGFMITKRNTEE